MSNEIIDTTDDDTTTETDTGATTQNEAGGSDPGDNLPSLHQQLVAAPSIEIETDAAKLDGQWTKSLFIVGYPDTATTGMLDRALSSPNITFDYSIHIHPRDTSETVTALEDSLRDMEVKRSRKAESGDVTQLETTKTIDEHTAIYEALLDGTQDVFEVSIYLTVRAASKQAVTRAAERLRSDLQGAQLAPTTAAYRQRDALVSTSPIARDTLDQTVTMLGDAVGCLFPFSMGTHIDEAGVPLGYHSVTGAPIVVDRFQRETGYNWLVMGNTGAGKTFTTMLNLLRRLAKDEETLVIMADPFGDLGGLTEILDGERITVSGSQALNPLELTSTPQRVLEANPDLTPYKTTVQTDAIGFVEAFFAMEGMTLEGKRGLLSVALHEAYRRHGITPDPSTHDNPSPTLRDVRAVLREVIDDPAAFIDDAPDVVADTEAELWQRRASQLRMDLAPFRAGGEYEHLGRATEIDLHGSDVLYLDMQQLEGGQKTGVMLQLLLHAVYERAKETPKRVIFAIDEAHYLLRTGASLEFLERAVRHARHYDLSLQFITQTADEFFSDDYEQAAKVIADNCAVKLFHQVEGLSDANAAEWLGLSPPEAAFVRNAQPGSEEYGYSQALIEIGDAGRLPVNIRSLSEEAAIIEDSRERSATYSAATERAQQDQLASGGSQPVVDTSADRSSSGHDENRIESRQKVLQERESAKLFNRIDAVESIDGEVGDHTLPDEPEPEEEGDGQ